MVVVKVNSNGHFLLDMIGHDKKRTSATKDKLGWSQFFSSICSLIFALSYIGAFEKEFFSTA